LIDYNLCFAESVPESYWDTSLPGTEAVGPVVCCSISDIGHALRRDRMFYVICQREVLGAWILLVHFHCHIASRCLVVVRLFFATQRHVKHCAELLQGTRLICTNEF